MKKIILPHLSGLSQTVNHLQQQQVNQNNTNKERYNEMNKKYLRKILSWVQGQLKMTIEPVFRDMKIIKVIKNTR